MMSEVRRAYVDVNADGYWALFEGDGSESEPVLLAVGGAFEPGEPINEVMDGLQQWATENDYVILPPVYSKNDGVNLDDLFNDD